MRGWIGRKGQNLHVGREGKRLADGLETGALRVADVDQRHVGAELVDGKLERGGAPNQLRRLNVIEIVEAQVVKS